MVAVVGIQRCEVEHRIELRLCCNLRPMNETERYMHPSTRFKVVGSEVTIGELGVTTIGHRIETSIRVNPRASAPDRPRSQRCILGIQRIRANPLAHPFDPPAVSPAGDAVSMRSDQPIVNRVIHTVAYDETRLSTIGMSYARRYIVPRNSFHGDLWYAW